MKSEDAFDVFVFGSDKTKPGEKSMIQFMLMLWLAWVDDKLNNLTGWPLKPEVVAMEKFYKPWFNHGNEFEWKDNGTLPACMDIGDLSFIPRGYLFSEFERKFLLGEINPMEIPSFKKSFGHHFRKYGPQALKNMEAKLLMEKKELTKKGQSRKRKKGSKKKNDGGHDDEMDEKNDDDDDDKEDDDEMDEKNEEDDKEDDDGETEEVHNSNDEPSSHAMEDRLREDDDEVIDYTNDADVRSDDEDFMNLTKDDDDASDMPAVVNKTGAKAFARSVNNAFWCDKWTTKQKTAMLQAILDRNGLDNINYSEDVLMDMHEKNDFGGSDILHFLSQNAMARKGAKVKVNTNLKPTGKGKRKRRSLSATKVSNPQDTTNFL